MTSKLAQITPHIPLILGVLGLVCLVVATFTIARAELGTTLGLYSTGIACFVLEWRITHDPV